jgi:hypothetical protein
MSDEEDMRRRPSPLGPVKPLERPWPTPTPGVPFPVRERENETLRQILAKLEQIEKRLERIEKILTEKLGAI